MVSGTRQDNLFNIDHGKALAPHREAVLFSMARDPRCDECKGNQGIRLAFVGEV